MHKLRDNVKYHFKLNLFQCHKLNCVGFKFKMQSNKVKKPVTQNFVLIIGHIILSCFSIN